MRARARGVAVAVTVCVLPCRHADGDDLIYEKLPHDIARRHVLLLDPILGTGNTVVRAMRVHSLSPPALSHLSPCTQFDPTFRGTS